MKQKYDFKEFEDYLNVYGSPEWNAAKINEVIVIMTDWFTEVGDPCFKVFDLKDCMNFLLNLRQAIKEVKAV